MAYHYGRDALINSSASANRNNGQTSALIYHLLRTAGCDNLWECDGEVGPNGMNPNHVDDGNMEEVGTAKYVTVGAGSAIAKDTTIVDSGLRSLKITSGAGVNFGARTIALLSMVSPAGRAFDAGDSLVGPTAEKMTLNDNNNPFTTNDIGCPITITGEGNAGNNGTFIVTKFNAIGAIEYQNSSGVAVAPPTGSYEIRRPYEITLWAYNNSGVAWNVDVDRGDGSYYNVGTIPHNAGVWTKYHYAFETLSSGSRYIRIVDTSGSSHEIYVDSMMVFRSSYEYQRLNVYGSDGILTNPDQFSTAGSYTPNQRDVGRWLVIWDATNPKNTGWYKIIANLGGGSIQVDMRSATATFTNQGGLTWRIVDVENQWRGARPNHQQSSGFGIESIHGTAWRLFWRMANTATTNYNFDWIWSSPEDTDFDRSTGNFYYTGPSTQRYREGPYRYGDFSTQLAHGTFGGITAGVLTSRTFLMTDDDISFISVVHWNVTDAYHGAWSVGYMGADASHPGIEEFSLIARSAAFSTSSDEIAFSFTNYNAWYYGTTFLPDGTATLCSIGSYGYGASTAVIDQSNASDNPWSAEEVIYPIPLLRDVDGTLGYPSEREISKGMYMCRANLPTLATFDSNGYLHFKNGYCWKWNGEAIV